MLDYKKILTMTLVLVLLFGGIPTNGFQGIIAENTEVAYADAGSVDAPANATISSFTVKQPNGTSVTLSPAFTPSTHTYTATVGKNVSSVVLTALLSNGATAYLGEEGRVRYLAAGDNTIAVSVKGLSSSANAAYTFNIHRTSTDANLRSLALGTANKILFSGGLTPEFDPKTTSYTTSYIPDANGSIQVFAETSSKYASVTLSVSALNSQQYTVVGNTITPISGVSLSGKTINVLVTAEDGSTKTYSTVLSADSITDTTIISLNGSGNQNIIANSNGALAYSGGVLTIQKSGTYIFTGTSANTSNYGISDIQVIPTVPRASAVTNVKIILVNAVLAGGILYDERPNIELLLFGTNIIDYFRGADIQERSWAYLDDGDMVTIDSALEPGSANEKDGKLTITGDLEFSDHLTINGGHIVVEGKDTDSTHDESVEGNGTFTLNGGYIESVPHNGYYQLRGYWWSFGVPVEYEVNMGEPAYEMDDIIVNGGVLVVKPGAGTDLTPLNHSTPGLDHDAEYTGVTDGIECEDFIQNGGFVYVRVQNKFYSFGVGTNFEVSEAHIGRGAALLSAASSSKIEFNGGVTVLYGHDSRNVSINEQSDIFFGSNAIVHSGTVSLGPKALLLVHGIQNSDLPEDNFLHNGEFILYGAELTSHDSYHVGGYNHEPYREQTANPQNYQTGHKQNWGGIILQDGSLPDADGMFNEVFSELSLPHNFGLVFKGDSGFSEPVTDIVINDDVYADRTNGEASILYRDSYIVYVNNTPRNLTVAAGASAGTATFSWLPPAYAGQNSSVERYYYKVINKETGVTVKEWTAGTNATSVSISGLPTNVPLKFLVKAYIKNNGVSPASYHYGLANSKELTLTGYSFYTDPGTPTASGDAALSGLNLTAIIGGAGIPGSGTAGYSLLPAFSPNVTSYTARVASYVDSIQINATGNGTIKVAVEAQSGLAVGANNTITGLATGANDVFIQVRSADGQTTQVYNLTIIKASTSITQIGGIDVYPTNGDGNIAGDARAITPAFYPLTHRYSASIPYNFPPGVLIDVDKPSSVAVTMTAQTLNGNNIPLVTGSTKAFSTGTLSIGDNPASVLAVDASANDAVEYEVALHRMNGGPEVTKLDNLSLQLVRFAYNVSPPLQWPNMSTLVDDVRTPVTLTPVFNKETQVYEACIDADADGATGDGDPANRVRIRALGVEGGVVAISGEAQDGTALSFPGYYCGIFDTIHYAGGATYNFYTHDAPAGYVSNPWTDGFYVVGLKPGANYIHVMVTPEDANSASTRTYNIVLYKGAGQQQQLGSLEAYKGTSASAANALTLTPPYSASEGLGVVHTATVNGTVENITITAAALPTGYAVNIYGYAQDGTPLVPIAGTGGANSQTLHIYGGLNQVLVHLYNTNVEGYGRTYHINITKELSNNADLAGLMLNNNTNGVGTSLALTPAFSPSVTSYEASAWGITSAIVSAQPSDPFATAIISAKNGNGVELAGGGIGFMGSFTGLVLGTNQIDIAVTAQDGTATKTYTINLNRVLDSNAHLSTLNVAKCNADGTGQQSIAITPVDLSQSTNGYVYTAAADTSTTAALIHAESAFENADIESVTVATDSGLTLSNYGDAENTWLVNGLSYGTNTVSIKVRAEDGVHTLTYTLNIEREWPSLQGSVSLKNAAGQTLTTTTTVRYGDTISADASSFSGWPVGYTPTYTFKWFRGSTLIATHTSATPYDSYTVGSAGSVADADIAQRLKVQVSASGTSGQKESIQTKAVDKALAAMPAAVEVDSPSDTKIQVLNPVPGQRYQIRYIESSTWLGNSINGNSYITAVAGTPLIFDANGVITPGLTYEVRTWTVATTTQEASGYAYSPYILAATRGNIAITDAGGQDIASQEAYFGYSVGAVGAQGPNLIPAQTVKLTAGGGRAVTIESISITGEAADAFELLQAGTTPKTPTPFGLQTTYSNSTYAVRPKAGLSAGSSVMQYPATLVVNYRDNVGIKEATASLSFTVTIDHASATVEGLSVGYAPGGRTLASATAEMGGTVKYMLGTGLSDETTPETTATGWSTTAPTAEAVDTYRVWYYVSADAVHFNSEVDYVTANITKATPEATVTPTGVTVNYNGSAQNLVNPGASSTGMLKYSTSETGEFSVEIPQATNAGTYTVYWYVSGDANYTNSEISSVTGEIRRVPASVVSAPHGREDDFAEGQLINLIEGGLASGGVFIYSSTSDAAGPWSDDMPTATVAGTYLLWWQVSGDANHTNTSPQLLTATIRQVPASTDTPPTGLSIPYNGFAQNLVSPGASSTGALKYSTSAAEGTWSTDIPQAINVGTYYVYYQVPGDENHTPGTSSAPIIATISAITAEFASYPEGKTFEYSGDAQSLITAGTPESGIIRYSLADSLSDATPDPVDIDLLWTANAASIEATDAGTYRIWYYIDADSNYTDTEVFSVTATINKVPASAYPEPTGRTLDYSGSPQDLVGGGTPKGGTFRYRLSEEDEWQTAAPQGTDVGTYYIYYQVSGDGNHTTWTADAPLTATIGTVQASVAASPQAISPNPYSASAPKQLITAGTPDGGTLFYWVGQTSDSEPEQDDMSGSWTSNVANVVGTDAGPYRIWYYVNADSNHTNSDTYYIDATIDATEPEFTAPTAKQGLAYTVDAQTLINAGNSGGTGTLYYAVTASGENAPAKGTTEPWTTNAADIKGTDAGGYSVWYYLKGGANYQDSDIEHLTVSIDKAVAAAATPPAARLLAYNGSYQALISSGESNDGTLYYKKAASVDEATPTSASVKAANITNSNVSSITGRNLEQYKVWYYISGNTNHYDSSVEAVLVSINSGIPEFATHPSAVAGLVWTGNSQRLISASTPAAIAEGSTGTIYYKKAAGLDETTSDAATDEGWTEYFEDIAADGAGDHKIWYYIAGTGSYGNSAVYSLIANIAKVEPTLLSTPEFIATQDYTGEQLVLLATPGSAEYGTWVYKVDTGAYSEATPTAVAAGEHTIWYRIKGDGNHYDTTPESVTAEILAIDAEIGELIAKEEVEYSPGVEHELVEQPTATGGSIYYAVYDSLQTTTPEPAELIGQDNVSSTIPTRIDGGTYYVYAQVKGDDNHNNSQVVIASPPFVINPIIPTVTIGTISLLEGEEFTYDEEEHLLYSGSITSSNGTVHYTVALLGTTPQAANTEASLSALGWKTSLSDVKQREGGTYQLWYFVLGNLPNYANSGPAAVEGTVVTINPIDIDPDAVKTPTRKQDATWEANGNQLVNAGTVEGGVGTFWYNMVPAGATPPAIGDAGWTTSSAVGIAGSYNVYYYVKGDLSHNDMEIGFVPESAADSTIAQISVFKAYIESGNVISPEAIEDLHYRYYATQELVTPGSVSSEYGTIWYKLEQTSNNAGGDGGSNAQKAGGTSASKAVPLGDNLEGNFSNTNITSGAEWSATVPYAKDNATYTVYWFVSGDANHYDYLSQATPDVIEVTIGAAWYEFTTPPAARTSLVYNGEEQALMDVDWDDVPPVASGELLFYWKSASNPASMEAPEWYDMSRWTVTNEPVARDAGTYVVHWRWRSLVSGEEDVIKYAIVTIAKKTLTASGATPDFTAPRDASPEWTGGFLSLIQAGNANGKGTLYYMLAESLSGGTPSAVAASSTDAQILEAGWKTNASEIAHTTAEAYKVWYFVKASDTANYNNSSIESITAQIRKASGSVATPPAAKAGLKWNGSKQQLISAEGASATGKLYYIISSGEPTGVGISSSESDFVSAGWTQDIADISGESVGTLYQIWYVSVGDSNHYNSPLTVTSYIAASIAKADGAFRRLPESIGSVTYTGNSRALISVRGAAVGDGVVYYKKAASVDEATPSAATIKAEGITIDNVFSSITGQAVGMYKIWYYAEGDANHEDTPVAFVTAEITKVNSAMIVGTTSEYTTATGLRNLVQKTEGPAAGDAVYYMVASTEPSVAEIAIPANRNHIPQATAAGTYTVWYYVPAVGSWLASDVESVTATIEAASMPTGALISVPAAAEPKPIYGGSDTLILSAGAVSSTEYKLEYSFDGESWTPEVASITQQNAGRYTVWYRLSDAELNYLGNANHTSKIVSFEAEILRAQSSVNPAPQPMDTATYASANKTLVKSVGSVSGGNILFAYEKKTGSTPSILATGDASVWKYTASNLPKASDAGTYVVWWYVSGDGNHFDTAVASFEATIQKADASIGAQPTAYGNLSYNDREKRLLLAAGTAVGGELWYKVTTQDAAQPSTANTTGWTNDYQSVVKTDAGSYTVWFYVKGDANHNDSTVDSLNVSIAKVSSSITRHPEAIVRTYNGLVQEIATRGTALGGTIYYQVCASGEGMASTDDATKWSTATPSAISAGTYTIWYYVRGDNNHFNTGFYSTGAEMNIADFDETHIIEYPYATNPAYTGYELPLVTGGAVDPDFGIEYAIEYILVGDVFSGASWLDSPPTAIDAGSYTVLWRVVGANYSALQAFISASIEKAQFDEGSLKSPQPHNASFEGEDILLSLANAGEATGGAIFYASAEGEAGIGAAPDTQDTARWSSEIPQASAAGKYTVWWYASADSNHFDSAVSSFTASIDKVPASASPVPTATMQTWTGSVKNLITAGTAEGGTLLYRLGAGGEFSAAIPQATAADSYVVQWYVSGDANHTNSEISTINASIGKAQATVTTAPTGRTLSYTGSAQELVSGGGIAVGGTFRYSTVSAEGPWTTVTPTATNADTYSVWYQVSGDANHNSTTGELISPTPQISKAQATATTAPTGRTLSYTGSAQELVSGGIAVGGTLRYSTAGATGPWTTAIPKGTNIATYPVWYQVSGDANHTSTAGLPISPTPSIGKSSANVSSAPIGNTALIYNASAQSLLSNQGTASHGTLFYTKTVSGDGITPIAGQSGAWGAWSTAVPGATDAGSYIVWYFASAESANYSDSGIASVRATIAKKQAVYTATPEGKSGAASQEYTGSPIDLLSTEGVAENGNLTVLYAVTTSEAAAPPDSAYTEAAPQRTNAGTYTIWYKVNETSNYKGIAAAHTQAQIYPRMASSGDESDIVKTQPQDAGHIYNGYAQDLLIAGELEADATGFALDYCSMEYANVTDLFSGTGWGSIPQATDAGTYPVVWRVSGNGNYNAFGGGIDAHIYKANMSVASGDYTQPLGTTATYEAGNGKPLVQAGTGTATNGTVHYAYAKGTYTAAAAPATTESAKWSSTPQAIDAGTYTVWWYVSGDKNHNDTSVAAFQSTINKERATAQAAFYSATYDGTSHALVTAATPGASGLTLNYKLADSTSAQKPEAGAGSGWKSNKNEIVATNAGSYKVWYYVLGNSNYATSEVYEGMAYICKKNISAAAGNLVLPVLTEATCTGTSYPLATGGAVNAGGAILYAFEENGAAGATGTAPATNAANRWSTEVPTATDVGTYTVWWFVSPDANHIGTGISSFESKIHLGMPMWTGEDFNLPYDAVTGKSYTAAITTSEVTGAGVINYGVIGLPAGMSFEDGKVTGTPESSIFAGPNANEASEEFTFIVCASNEYGEATAEFTLVVYNPSKLATGWYEFGGKTYHYKNGVSCVGWSSIDDEFYYFDDDGAAAIGWRDIEGDTYYFRAENPGLPVTGEQPIDGVTYFFDEYGILQSEPPAQTDSLISLFDFLFSNPGAIA